MMNLSGKGLFFALCFGFFTLFSCTARIDGSLETNGSARLTVSMSLGQRITSLIRSFSSAGGQQTEQILDGASIAKSMTGSPGVSSVTFRNTSASSVEGQILISHIDEFFGKFITFEQKNTSGRCVININRDNASVILESLSSEVTDYLTAILAPIAIGDEMTKPEYLELVTVFYNKAVSDEISASRIRASIDFPANVKTVKGGVSSGRKAVFDVPLVDLLVLETPLNFEVTW
ncbi:MAG: hypothetical protein FWB95_08780 [Treponema sp.]|nr:hypothetical protein [Treponema sp.]MCL2212001.1 hypothetical protein [Treponema sp.]